MKALYRVFSLASLAAFSSPAQVPDNLVAEGIPPFPPELKANAGHYLEFRGALFNHWHPLRREMLVTTRFADAAQLHHVKMPGGARRQLTFTPDPVSGGMFRPKTGEFIVFVQDTGGGEFYQLYRLDPADGKITLLTDGKSRHESPKWSRSGKLLAYTSTQRNGKDNDIWVMNPAAPSSARLVSQVPSGGWRILDWSHDESKLLLGEEVSVNESYLHLLDLRTGARELLTPRTDEKIVWDGGQFAPDDQSLYTTTDERSEFQRLARFDLKTRAHRVLTPNLKWDVESFELSPDGATLAYTANEDGASTLHLLNPKTVRERTPPRLPAGLISRLEWHDNGRDLAFNLNSARSPMDVYSLDLKSGQVERWTESETGGLNPETFIEPELVRIKSFDGLPISGYLYRPDAKKFPGPRPVLINIHGGPEGQTRPTFQGRNNYALNELGLRLLPPNVRGSTGYGKTFVTLDNGFKREDSVRDIGAFLDWIKQDPRLDPSRIAVTGGSYGGYMVLACMTHYSPQLRCGVDVVGISNFLTFLKNTQDYRRDLRRVEYGDERDENMREFLGRISPMTSVKKITKPLFVVQGRNDPRVPLSEAEQMVKARSEE